MSSQPPLGPAQSLFNVQQMEAVMFPLIRSQTLDRPLNNNNNNPLIWGHTFLMHLTKNPLFEQVMSFLLLPARGEATIKLVGLILGVPMHLGVLKTLVMSPFQEVSILPNKEVILRRTTVSFRWEDMLNIPTRWV